MSIVKEKEDLLKILKIIKSFNVYFYGMWQYSSLLKKFYSENKLKLIEGGFDDVFKRKHWKFDLSDDNLWRTYDSCINGTILFENDKIFAKIIIYDGEMLYGFREKIRWEALFEIFDQQEFLNYFRNNIQDRFNSIVEAKYQEEEELKKKMRILEIKKNLLLGNL